jgi:hypothetical protein
MNFLELIGKPENDAELQHWITNYPLFDYGLSDDWIAAEKESNKKYSEEERKIFESLPRTFAQYVDNENGVNITLQNKVYESEELFIASIQLGNTYKWQYPFDLHQHFTYDEVSFGTKIKFYKSTYLEILYIKEFLVEEFKVEVFFNNEKIFYGVTITKIASSDIAHINFYASLKTQKQNIINDFSNIKQALQSTNPVVDWKIRRSEGDKLFTNENLAASEKVIFTFIEELESAVKTKSTTAILKAVKTITKQFNKLNKTYQSFIETTEREELVLYINDVVKKVGLILQDGFDITWEWRDNW